MSSLRTTQRPIWTVLPPVGTRVELLAGSPYTYSIPAGSLGTVADWYGEPDPGGDHDARYVSFPLWVLFDGQPPPDGKHGWLCQPGELRMVQP